MKNKLLAVLDLVGEYQLPKFVNPRMLYDSYKVEDLLNIVNKTLEETRGKPFSEKDQIEIERDFIIFLTRGLKYSDVVKEIREGITEPEGDIYKLILDFKSLQKWSELVIKYAEEASGDDDYFDYFPSYLDVFRQACSAFKEEGGEELWKETLKKVVPKIDAESECNFLEVAIYTSSL